MSEVVCITIMKAQLTIPEDAPAHKRRGFVRMGDLITAQRVTVDNLTYTLDGITWGFNSDRSDQAHAYVFVTGCPDGATDKLNALIPDTASDPDRFSSLYIDIENLPNPVKLKLQNTGYVQITAGQLNNYINKKIIVDRDNPNADTKGQGLTVDEVQA